jgi:hypothetical protein
LIFAREILVHQLSQLVARHCRIVLYHMSQRFL